MTLLDIFGLLALVALGWLLWDSLRVREIANQAMGSTCKAEGLLFLDDTVALQSLRASRDDAGVSDCAASTGLSAAIPATIVAAAAWS